jgi:hypothetical protein
LSNCLVPIGTKQLGLVIAGAILAMHKLLKRLNLCKAVQIFPIFVWAQNPKSPKGASIFKTHESLKWYQETQRAPSLLFYAMLSADAGHHSGRSPYCRVARAARGFLPGGSRSRRAGVGSSSQRARSQGAETGPVHVADVSTTTPTGLGKAKPCRILRSRPQRMRIRGRLLFNLRNPLRCPSASIALMIFLNSPSCGARCLVSGVSRVHRRPLISSASEPVALLGSSISLRQGTVWSELALPAN